VERFGAETGPELRRLLGELNSLSVSLRRLSDKAERNTAGLLLGSSPVPDGPGEGMQAGHQ
jgi:phospholipid/cholesterol/gamma-HCH transport system substrate-binding protein